MHTLPGLPDAIAREVFATLCTLLPPPPVDTDEARADRARAAMASVAALQPEDAFEADLAALAVGAFAHAKDCLRLAARPGQEPRDVDRCRAQAAMMTRQALGLLRELQRRRPERDRREATAPERPDAPPPQPGHDRRLTEAETYAVTYPDRAARIRAAGGLPRPLDFDPPRHSLVRAIVNSASPILRALDRGAMPAAAGLASGPDVAPRQNVSSDASPSHMVTP